MKEDHFSGIVILGFLCVVIGAFTAYVVFPWYLHLDLVRNVGMSTVKSVDQESKSFLQICLLGGAAFVLFPALLFARTLKPVWKQTLFPLAVSLLWPWSLLCLLALVGGTVLDVWYRGLLNATALFSLPLLNWLLSWGALRALRRRQML